MDAAPPRPAMIETERVPIEVELIEWHPCRRGAIVAAATVRITVGPLELELQNVLVRHWRDEFTVQVPQSRCPITGNWADAIVLPPEAIEAIADLLLAEVAPAHGAELVGPVEVTEHAA